VGEKNLSSEIGLTEKEFFREATTRKKVSLRIPKSELSNFVSNATPSELRLCSQAFTAFQSRPDKRSESRK